VEIEDVVFEGDADVRFLIVAKHAEREVLDREHPRNIS
jgi:hypothetical protein